MIEIFEESVSDLSEVEGLLDLTFGPGRHALSSYRLRDGVSPVSKLCLIMRDEFNVLVGVIRFWPIFIGVQKSPGLLLGPLGIHPTRQGEGLGEILIGRAMKKAKNLGWVRVILVGDINYYQRFGFSRSLISSIYLSDTTSNHRLLGNELVEGSMLNLSGPLLNFLQLQLIFVVKMPESLRKQSHL